MRDPSSILYPLSVADACVTASFTFLAAYYNFLERHEEDTDPLDHTPLYDSTIADDVNQILTEAHTAYMTMARVYKRFTANTPLVAEHFVTSSHNPLISMVCLF